MEKNTEKLFIKPLLIGGVIFLVLILFQISDLIKGQKELIKILKATTQPVTQPVSRPSKP